MSIYRQYENPWVLEEELEELTREKEEFVHTDDNWEEYVDLCIKFQEMKDRVNFAWQDEYEDC